MPLATDSQVRYGTVTVLVRRFLRHARLLVTPFLSSCYDGLQRDLEATWRDGRIFAESCFRAVGSGV